MMGLPDPVGPSGVYHCHYPAVAVYPGLDVAPELELGLEPGLGLAVVVVAGSMNQRYFHLP